MKKLWKVNVIEKFNEASMTAFSMLYANGPLVKQPHFISVAAKFCSSPTSDWKTSSTWWSSSRTSFSSWPRPWTCRLPDWSCSSRRGRGSCSWGVVHLRRRYVGAVDLKPLCSQGELFAESCFSPLKSSVELRLKEIRKNIIDLAIK